MCTAIFLAKFAIATAALVPLYLAGTVIPLGLAATLLGGAPAAGVCLNLSWQILREDPQMSRTAYRLRLRRSVGRRGRTE